MKIAIEGCCHDQLEVIYDTLELIQRKENIKIDLLLICGDFQATRNPDDLQCMAVPPKYRGMNYFYKYYKKEKTAPMLTIVIGGNHEASNHMQELPYGGWLAPNIYYMGYAGIVDVGGVRIGGMSGIYKGKDYHKGHFEHPPYSGDAMRSCYHIRSLEVFRLKQVHSHVDIMMSHDWPVHAVHAGNIEQLLRWKPDFRDEIESDTLGSPPAQEVLNHLKPTYWFSAHLHCKYPAVIKHKSDDGGESKITQFLALDKCLPRRQFLQVIDVATEQPPPYKITLDAEWLCILKSTNHLLSLSSNHRYMPGLGCKERYDFSVTKEDKDALLEDFGDDLSLPENFEITVTPYDGVSDKRNGKQPGCQVNPQTTLLCQMLGLTDPFAVFCGKASADNPDEINLDMESDESDGGVVFEDDNMESAFDDTKQPSADTTTTDFPTFIHSMTVNESQLNDSVVNDADSCPNISVQEEPTADTSEAGTSEAGPSLLDSRKRPSREDHEENKNNSEQPLIEEISKGTGQRKMKRRNVAMYSILTSSATDESSDT